MHSDDALHALPSATEGRVLEDQRMRGQLGAHSLGSTLPAGRGVREERPCGRVGGEATEFVAPRHLLDFKSNSKARNSCFCPVLVFLWGGEAVEKRFSK